MQQNINDHQIQTKSTVSVCKCTHQPLFNLLFYIKISALTTGDIQSSATVCRTYRRELFGCSCVHCRSAFLWIISSLLSRQFYSEYWGEQMSFLLAFWGNLTITNTDGGIFSCFIYWGWHNPPSPAVILRSVCWSAHKTMPQQLLDQLPWNLVKITTVCTGWFLITDPPDPPEPLVMRFFSDIHVPPRMTRADVNMLKC